MNIKFRAKNFSFTDGAKVAIDNKLAKLSEMFNDDTIFDVYMVRREKDYKCEIKVQKGKDFIRAEETGQTIEFAVENIFHPLGIINAKWNQTDDGTTEGGIGIHISCDDILKLGVLYLNKGMFNGKRILSDEWICKATSFVSDNSGNGDINWCSGYGYQIWLNNNRGFRGDGALGQLCVVLPEQEAVVAVTAVCENVPYELSSVFTLIDNIYKLEEPKNSANYQFDVYEKCELTQYSFLNKYIKLAENPLGFSKVLVEYEGEKLAIRLVNKYSEQTIYAGNGEYIKSCFRAKWKKPKLFTLMHAKFEEDISVASCYRTEQDKIVVFMRYLNSPSNEFIYLRNKDGKFYMEFENRFLKESAKILREA